jgi:uncharacterized protein (UPF0332 family)
MNLEECFEKRLLRNAPRDRLKSEKAIEMAQRAIIQAEKLLEHGFYEQVILYSYTGLILTGSSAMKHSMDLRRWT